MSKNMNDLSILGKSHTFDFCEKTNDLKLIGSMSSDIKYKVRTHIRRSINYRCQMDQGRIVCVS